MNKTALDYSQLAANQQQMLIVNTAINVTNYREGTLLVRVHGAPTIAGDSSIQVILVRTAPSEEDPALLFASTEPALATVTINPPYSRHRSHCGVSVQGGVVARG